MPTAPPSTLRRAKGSDPPRSLPYSVLGSQSSPSYLLQTLDPFVAKLLLQLHSPPPATSSNWHPILVEDPQPPQPNVDQAFTIGRCSLAAQPALNAELTLRATFHLVDEIDVNINLLTIGKSEPTGEMRQSHSAGSTMSAADANSNLFNSTLSSTVVMTASATLSTVQAKKQDLLDRMVHMIQG